MDRSVRSISLIMAGVVLLYSPELSAQIYRTDADTGRMTWGHMDYHRYTGVDVCDRAVAQMAASERRAYTPDTAFAPSTDPQAERLPESVITVARTCAGRFTADSVDPRDLWNFIRIALVLGEDTKVTAAVERIRTLQTTDIAQADMLLRAIQLLMNSVPRRLHMVEGFLSQLESIGAAAKIHQFQTHLILLEYWYGQYNIDSIRRHADQAISLGRTMDERQLAARDIRVPYEQLISLANAAGDLRMQESLLDQASRDLTTRLGGQVEFASMTRLFGLRKEMYGKQARVLDGAYWFNHQGVRRPVAGTLSLVVRMRQLCGMGCGPMIEMIKSLHRKYGADLSVIITTDTRGRAHGSGPLTPEEEARSAADYFLRYHGLPVALVVDETPTSKRPDGRISRESGKWEGIYGGQNSLLIDQNGKIQWIGVLESNKDRRMLEVAIERATRSNADQSTQKTMQTGT